MECSFCTWNMAKRMRNKYGSSSSTCSNAFFHLFYKYFIDFVSSDSERSGERTQINFNFHFNRISSVTYSDGAYPFVSDVFTTPSTQRMRMVGFTKRGRVCAFNVNFQLYRKISKGIHSPFIDEFLFNGTILDMGWTIECTLRTQ